MKDTRQEELEMLIEKTRDKLEKMAGKIQHMNTEHSYTDQSYLDDVIIYAKRLKIYQLELSVLINEIKNKN